MPFLDSLGLLVQMILYRFTERRICPRQSHPVCFRYLVKIYGELYADGVVISIRVDHYQVRDTMRPDYGSISQGKVANTSCFV